MSILLSNLGLPVAQLCTRMVQGSQRNPEIVDLDHQAHIPNNLLTYMLSAGCSCGSDLRVRAHPLGAPFAEGWDYRSGCKLLLRSQTIVKDYKSGSESMHFMLLLSEKNPVLKCVYLRICTDEEIAHERRATLQETLKNLLNVDIYEEVTL